jgi:hypothetical protein
VVVVDVELVDVVVEVVVLTTDVVVVSSDADVIEPHADTTSNPARIISRLVICAVYPRAQMHLRCSSTRGVHPISCTVQG